MLFNRKNKKLYNTKSFEATHSSFCGVVWLYGRKYLVQKHALWWDLPHEVKTQFGWLGCPAACGCPSWVRVFSQTQRGCLIMWQAERSIWSWMFSLLLCHSHWSPLRVIDWRFDLSPTRHYNTHLHTDKHVYLASDCWWPTVIRHTHLWWFVCSGGI